MPLIGLWMGLVEVQVSWHGLVEVRLGDKLKLGILSSCIFGYSL